MSVAGVVTKRTLVLTLSKKNQHRTLHLERQWAGFMVNPNSISVMVVRNTHLYRVHISFKLRVDQDNID